MVNLKSASQVILGLVTFFPSLRSVMGFPQELIIYWREPINGQPVEMQQLQQRFTEPVADSSIFPWNQKVDRYCFTGKWSCFDYANFFGRVQAFSFGGGSNMYKDQDENGAETGYTCEKYSEARRISRFTGLPYPFVCKSFRPQGGPDTELSAISFYGHENLEGPELRVVAWDGQEDVDATTTVTTRQYNNITQHVGPVKSMAWTGNGSWTLFQEPNFGGLAQCINPVELGSPGRFHRTRTDTEVMSVGSVLPGCDSKNFGLRNALPRIKKMAGEFGQFYWDMYESWRTNGQSRYVHDCYFMEDDNEICS